VKGLKIGILKEGFEFEDMKQDVAEFVKVAAREIKIKQDVAHYVVLRIPPLVHL
jgi:hypothetical protein